MMAASRNSNRRHDDDHPRQGFVFNADSNIKADDHIGQHLRRRSTWWCSRSTLWLMVCIASVGWAPQLSDAQKGYDKEEKPTGLWYGYCLPRQYDQKSGICGGFSGSPSVCTASSEGTIIKSSLYWLDNEIFNQRAPHTDKSLVRGSQAYETLQLYILSWVCKQIGDNVRPKTTLTPDEKQMAACNYVWRRDQEVQNNEKTLVPAAGFRWGTFQYKPPGQNLTTFMFKGIPRAQCAADYECRGLNTAGDVYTACDYCEEYFNKYCAIDPATVFRFCMETVHCVCNSVKKPCSLPRKDRCPKGEDDKYMCPKDTPDGMMFPIHGAPAASASRLSAFSVIALPSLLVALVTATLRA